MLDQKMIAMAKVPYMEAQCLRSYLRFLLLVRFPPVYFPRIVHGQYFGRPFTAGQVVISLLSIDVGD